MPASTYQHYEDRYQKEALPLTLLERLIPLLRARGIGQEALNTLLGQGGAAGVALQFLPGEEGSGVSIPIVTLADWQAFETHGPMGSRAEDRATLRNAQNGEDRRLEVLAAPPHQELCALEGRTRSGQMLYALVMPGAGSPRDGGLYVLAQGVRLRLALFEADADRYTARGVPSLWWQPPFGPLAPNTVQKLGRVTGLLLPL